MTTSISDNQRIFYAAGAAGGTIGKAVADGKLGLASTGQLTIGVSGNYRIAFRNDSLKSISLLRVAAFCTVTAYGSVFLNPTNGVPTNNLVESNAILGLGAPAGLAMGDTSTVTPLSGGVPMGITIPLGAGRRESIDLPPLILAPNGVIGMNFAAGASDGVFTIYWKVND